MNITADIIIMLTLGLGIGSSMAFKAIINSERVKVLRFSIKNAILKRSDDAASHLFGKPWV